MAVDLDLQIATDEQPQPSEEEFRRWCNLALQDKGEAELTVRIVDRTEIQMLNDQYRDKPKPTNVLSFPADLPEDLDLPLLGDLVICADVVNCEAKEQGKPTADHWAHMVIHGCLHLLGYDHIKESEAEEMESLEIQLLSQLSISNPY